MNSARSSSVPYQTPVSLNCRDLNHMTTSKPQLEFLGEGRLGVLFRNSAGSIDTAQAVDLHLAIRIPKALWNERDAPCIQ